MKKTISPVIVCAVVGSEKDTGLAKTEWLESRGRKLAYRSMGSGSPVILINRFRGTVDTWDPLFFEELAKSHRVIAFDYSGIGYSTGTLPTDLIEVAKDVKDLADALNIGKAAVAGWSYGGLVAQMALLQYPDLVSHAILIGTNPIGRNEFPLDPAFLAHALKPVNDIDDEFVLFFEPRSEISKELGRASHDRIYKNLDVSKIPATPDLFDRYAAGVAGNVEDDASRQKFIGTTKPVLAISGDRDISFPVENWYALTREMATTQQIVFPHTGHAPHHQYPELAADYIKNFIKRTT